MWSHSTFSSSLFTFKWCLVPRVTACISYCEVDQITQAGGSLVQKIPWTYGAKCDSICDEYAKRIARNYGSSHIVLDGYSDGPIAKTQDINAGQKV